MLASTYRFWRGTVASKTVNQPEDTLILFDREGDSDCRLVREVLTELNLDVIITPCPVGGKNLEQLQKQFNLRQLPIFVDNNHQVVCSGSKAICHHLFKHYQASRQPNKLLSSNQFSALKDGVTSKLASCIRLGAGTKARKSRQADLPLILYSFESSPYARPVREKLCELELTYILINIGKQQIADMGPAKMRWTLKPYQPLPNTKRDEFYQQYGNVQVPYLMDPNTKAAMFESEAILCYLESTYAL